MSAELSLRNIRIAYGNRVLLPQVDLRIAAGDVCVMTGVNGAGKTSLLRAALGLSRASSGAIHSTFQRPAYVPQSRAVDRQFPCSIEDVLRMGFPGFSYGMRARIRSERNARVNEILDAVGLEHCRSQQLRDCSGGEVQRAMIGRALVRDPDLLLLDEPTASLDEAGKARIRDLLIERNETQGLTVWMTSHEPEFWDRLATRWLRIEGGQCMETETEPESARAS